MKIFYFVSIILLCPAMAGAQQFISENFKRYQQQGFQEKIYLHTDKSAYSAGETVWFRAYRVDAMFHLPKFYSGLIYVDLYDCRDSLVRRMQIAPVDSCMRGSLKLPLQLVQGKYSLVTYSNWMQNFDEGFYFRKELFVYNPAELKVQPGADFRKDGQGNIKAFLKFTDEYSQTFSDLFVNVTLYNGKKKVKNYRNQPPDKSGKLDFSFPESWNVTSLEVEFADASPFQYKHNFFIPLFGRDFDVQFMPEGGHWLANVSQKIAFKAVGPDGKGISVTGTICDAAGQMVAVAGTSHEGMGSFAIQAVPGEKYSALMRTTDGREKKMELPVVEKEGITLQTAVRGEVFRCGVIATAGFTFPENLFLVLQCRGKVLAAIPVNKGMFSELPLSRLPSGILHCFLVTTNGTVYGEHLVFINKDDWPEMRVDGLLGNYGPRELVNLEFQIGAGGQVAKEGEFSISVTDRQKTLRDSMENNIVSHLMLCSDIKGNIENPYYYFDPRINREVRNRNADLLMMTQAWKRFDVAAVTRGDVPELPYYLELRQSISGRIKNFWGKEAAGGTLALVAPGVYRIINADKKGEFVISDISYPENTTFVVQGFAGKKSKFVEVDIDKPKFRPLDCLLPASGKEDDTEKKSEEDDFFKALKMDYYYENGVKVYVLDEVVIKADPHEGDDAIDQLYEDVSGNRITGDALMNEGYYSIWDWLSTVPGVNVDQATLEITVRGGQASIFVDDIPMSAEEIDRLPLSEIKSIGVVKNVANMSMIGEGSGGIVIRMKNGFSKYAQPKETLGFFRFTPMGYSVPDKFYEPKYETQAERTNPAVDERVTIYWNPDVRTDDNGRAKVSFYTADLSSTYSVILEGVTAAGEPVFQQFNIQRK